MTKSKEEKKASTPEKSKEKHEKQEKQTKKDAKTVDASPEVETVQHGTNSEIEKIIGDIKFLSRLLVFAVVLLLTFATRFYNLGEPTHIW